MEIFGAAGGADASQGLRGGGGYAPRMAVPQTVPVHKLALDDVLAMVEAGILDETAHVELEGGVLVDMVPPGEGHERQVEWLTRHFVKAVGEGVRVRIQGTFRIPDGGYYLPDVIVFGPKDDELPRTAELIIEVAVSSRSRDLEKAAVYAAAVVGEYWIVDVERQEVLVHSEPRHDGYALVRRYVVGERVPPPVDVPPVDVAELLGR